MKENGAQNVGIPSKMHHMIRRRIVAIREIKRVLCELSDRFVFNEHKILQSVALPGDDGYEDGVDYREQIMGLLRSGGACSVRPHVESRKSAPSNPSRRLPYRVRLSFQESREILFDPADDFSGIMG